MKVMVSTSALPPSQYRKYVKGWGKGRYEKVFSEFAEKGSYRVYLPLRALASGYIQAPEDISQAVTKLGWSVEDYRAGIAVDKSGKRRMRIGRLLSKTPDLKKKFNEDAARAGYRGKYIVCISRHPYDIAGASTDRGWYSCMNLIDGSHRSHIESEIKVGSLVAYLIEETDKNIKRPAARTMIKPFYREEDHSHSENPILIADQKVYGTNVSGFLHTVQHWLDTNLNKHRTEGIYHLNNESYDDGTNQHLSFDMEDSMKVNTLLRMGVEHGQFTNVRVSIRRLAFSAKPQLLYDFEHVLVNDVRAAANNDPMLAYKFLREHPDRVYDQSPEDQLQADHPTYRAEIKQLLLKAPQLYAQIEDELKLTDAEVSTFIIIARQRAYQYIPVSRYTDTIVNQAVHNLPRADVPAFLDELPPGMIPEDEVERLTKFPMLVILKNKLTEQGLKAALKGAGNEWHPVISAIRPDRYTRAMAEWFIEWLLDEQDDNDILRYGALLLADDLTRTAVSGNQELIIKVLKAIEHNSYDMVKAYGVVSMMNALQGANKTERFRTGLYWNSLKATFIQGALEMHTNDLEASIIGDEGLDFIRAETQILDELWAHDAAMHAGIDILVAHKNREQLMDDTTICRIDDKNLWTAFAKRDLTRCAKMMRKLLVSSAFTTLVPPYWFREEPLILELYMELQPQSIAGDEWFQQNIDKIHPEIRDQLRASGFKIAGLIRKWDAEQ